MALSQIQPQEEKQKGPSALENAAKVLGILTNIGSVGFQAREAFKKPTPNVSVLVSPTDPFYKNFVENKLGGK